MSETAQAVPERRRDDRGEAGLLLVAKLWRQVRHVAQVTSAHLLAELLCSEGTSSGREFVLGRMAPLPRSLFRGEVGMVLPGGRQEHVFLALPTAAAPSVLFVHSLSLENCQRGDGYQSWSWGNGS